MFPYLVHTRAKWAVQLRTVRARVFCRNSAVTALVILEGVVTAVPFLVSWLACSIYQAVLSGWLVSRSESAEKRAILTEVLGGNADPR